MWESKWSWDKCTQFTYRTQATEIPRLPQPQVTEIQHQVVQQGQLQVALLEVPLAHLEEDKSGFGCSVLKY